MLAPFKQLLANQFEAALCTLNACIDRCPDGGWSARVGNYAFSQVAFHALFYADFYLGLDEASLRRQPFHRGNEHFFGRYEELEDRPPVTLYEKAQLKTYLAHCRSKATEVVAAETDESLAARSGFGWLKFSRAELHVYNLRHLQYHASQLSLRLRIDHNVAVPWFGSGWRDV
jgi:DinB family protein